MLCGTGTDSPSSSEIFQESKELTRSETRLLLHLVCHSGFIKFDSDRIFLKTVGEARVTRLRTLLKSTFAKWDKKDEAEINAATNDILQEIILALSSKEQSTRKIDSSLDKKEEISPEINIDHYDWAVLCKLSMQQGNILTDSQEASVAMWIFLEQLKGLFIAFKSPLFKAPSSTEEPVAVFNKKLVRRHMTEFLGQLCAIEESSAQILHNYLHLALRVWNTQKTNLKRKASLAMAFGPGIFEGTKIFQEMLKPSLGDPLLSKEDLHFKNSELYHFFQLITAALIGDKIYSTPFDKRLYAAFKQASYKEELQKVQSRLTPRRRASIQGLLNALNLGSGPKEEEKPLEERKRRAINVTPRSTPTSPRREEVATKSPRTPRAASAASSSTSVTTVAVSSTSEPDFGALASSVFEGAASSPSASSSPLSPNSRHSKKGSVSFAPTITPRTTEQTPELSTSAPNMIPAFSLASRGSSDAIGDPKSSDRKQKNKINGS